MGFQYYRAPPQIEVILYLLFDTLWHQRITNCFGWEKEPCPNALSAQANDHKPDHNKRSCHSAEEKQTILPIEKVFTIRTAAIDGVGQHRLLLGNVCGTRVEYTCGGEGCLGN